MLSTLIHPRPVHVMGAARVPTVHPRVSLWLDTGTSAGQEIVKGVLSYVRSHTTWRVTIPERRHDKRAFPQKRPGDGLIAQIDEASQEAAVDRWDIPAVNVCGEYGESDLPAVSANDSQIGQLAYEHLKKLGFKRLGVCCRGGRHSAATRRRGFAKHAHADGREIATLSIDDDFQSQESRDAVTTWLAGQPKPFGILATDDSLGQKVLDICRAAGFSSPEDVAVLGVGNDELICGVADPPMSSVVLDYGRIGYEAARRLDRMLQKGARTSRRLQVEPIDVAGRRSTDALVVDDPDVAAAANFIRDNALQGIKVANVLEVVPISRRVLETRFRNQFGRTLHQAILGVQLDRIKELLRDTDLSMFQIASRTGFRHVEYMSVVFKREIGVSPSDYRNRWQEDR